MTTAHEKGIYVVLDASVVNSPLGPPILNSLSGTCEESLVKKKVFHYKVTPLSIHSSIAWILKSSNSDNWKLAPERLILLTGCELGQLLGNGSFHPWLKSLDCSMSNITLAIYEYASYFKSADKSSQRKKTALVRGEAARAPQPTKAPPKMSHTEAQRLLYEAQLKHGFNYMIFDSDVEALGKLVYHNTRALQESDAKERKRISQDYGFYAPTAKGNVAVNANGVGCLNLWQNALMQISQFIGIDRAKAISSIYPSPKALHHSLSNSPNPESLLTDIQVRRGADLLMGGSVKVGPEMSRKIAKMFLSHDENDTLQK